MNFKFPTFAGVKTTKNKALNQSVDLFDQWEIVLCEMCCLDRRTNMFSVSQRNKSTNGLAWLAEFDGQD